MSQWQKMIIDLKEQGLTQTQIATEINCSQNYVSNLENGLCGKRIGYDLGKRLERLWKAKQKQLAIQERDHAIATKAEISSRREATAMSTASKYKRKAEKLEALLDESQSFATIKKVQSITGGTYDTYELRRYSKAHGLEIQKAEDANYGSVNSYHKDAWLAVCNINISMICWGAA